MPAHGNEHATRVRNSGATPDPQGKGVEELLDGQLPGPICWSLGMSGTRPPVAVAKWGRPTSVGAWEGPDQHKSGESAAEKRNEPRGKIKGDVSSLLNDKTPEVLQDFLSRRSIALSRNPRRFKSAAIAAPPKSRTLATAAA
jgi:hypothetical protein